MQIVLNVNRIDARKAMSRKYAEALDIRSCIVGAYMWCETAIAEVPALWAHTKGGRNREWSYFDPAL